MMKTLLIILALMNPALSFAQGGGGNVGNGGGGYEPEFKYLSSLLKQWIQLGALNLDLRGLKKKMDWNVVIEAIDHVPVQFTHGELRVGDSELRACKNYPNADASKRMIECNFEAWDLVPSSQKLAVVFHEYLGITGYEENVGKYSTYPLSSQLIGKSLGDEKTGKSIADFLDASRVEGAANPQAAPEVILLWFRKLMHKQGQLTVSPNGDLKLNNYDPDEGRWGAHATALNGSYLKNGDYRVVGTFYESVSFQLGVDQLVIRHNSGGCGTTYSFTMIWNSETGIKAIDAKTNCMYQSMGGPTVTETVIQPDGSVSIVKYEKKGGSMGKPVKIWVNDEYYENHFVNPKLIR